MKTYVQPGEQITVAAPAAVVTGDGVLIGTLFGVAQETTAIGLDVVLIRRGVFIMPKATGTAWAVGGKLYWDNAAKNITTVVGANTVVGCAALAALSADTTGNVLLDGMIR